MAKPDYIVTVKGRDAKFSTRVGAAWQNEYGYSIKLDPGISISSAEGVYINLSTPREDADRAQPTRKADGGGTGGRSGGAFPKDDFGDDDIPFIRNELHAHLIGGAA
jgi:hypothetical protein